MIQASDSHSTSAGCLARARPGAGSAGGTRCPARTTSVSAAAALTAGARRRFAERDRDVVVLALEAERARHAAAARVHLAHLVARPTSARPPSGAVPTIAFWWQWPCSSAAGRGAGLRAQRQPARPLAQQELLEEQALPRHRRAPRRCAPDPTYSSRSVSRQEGSSPTIGEPARDAAGRAARRSTAASVARLVEHALGDHRPPAALRGRRARRGTRPPPAARIAGAADLRRVVGDERVVEQHHLAARRVAARACGGRTSR